MSKSFDPAGQNAIENSSTGRRVVFFMILLLAVLFISFLDNNYVAIVKTLTQNKVKNVLDYFQSAKDVRYFQNFHSFVPTNKVS